MPERASGEDIQNVVYEVGKTHGFEPLRNWFQALYEVLLGQSQGPRFGSFVELYGIQETREMIARVIKPADKTASKGQKKAGAEA
jgi:lysyl-tRNA synthetase class 1